MKKVYKFLTLATLTVAAVALTACGGSENTSEPPVYPEPADRGQWSVSSPDGSISARIAMNAQGELSYSVKKGDTIVVKPSALGMEIDNDDLSFLNVYKTSYAEISGEYDNIHGKSSHVAYDCNEVTVTFTSAEFYLDVVMRAYDDGYAFRYNVRAIDGSSGVLNNVEEKTEFTLDASNNAWAQPFRAINRSDNPGNWFAYEGSYTRSMVENFDSTQYLSFPMLYRVSGSDVYSLITESQLIGSGFYGSYLTVPSGMDGTGVLKTARSPASSSAENDIVSYPFSSPWRVGITGDLKTVVESELVEKVYDDAEYWKPDNYDELSQEEKDIYNYDWVEPGITVWNWIYNPNKQNDLNIHRQSAALAKEMGWKYVLLDGGINDANEGLPDFMAEMNAAGIKVLIWCDALNNFAKGNVDVLTYKLDYWQSLGIAGIKIDFFDGQTTKNPTHWGEDVANIEWYETIYQECAKRKMIVNCHGANKPTGERRIYPNVISREAVYGGEKQNLIGTYNINALFTRAVIGPTDFTPLVKSMKNDVSVAHQMALAVLFESGTLSFGDNTDVYLEPQFKDFYRSVPSARDQTLFLCGQLNYYYCGAVRSGDKWYVACINGLGESEVEVDFSFLESGAYDAEIYSDKDGADRFVSVNERDMTVRATDKLKFDVGEECGFVICLTKQI